ncbi:ATP-binding cassette domain-containing protein [Sporohalobacter salinus]|uniref:ATP-binding cassette domain-containing protein n=1 Tax=Sporohalobacter salinus TaxID=1494606 RepID=UPI001960B049|nr:ATP-binding cassette domain-containing protein [Sporohalobacter salinus]MBM7624633.1 ABC-2 type transport system ATP-binding protein [Sporohalobacter salinus]
MNSVIEVNNLAKNFGSIEAVRGINFAVKQGELFGFLGPNGAGKSTTIKMLCTLIEPTSGQAVVNGHDTMDNPGEVRQSIGLVFQEPSVDENLTAYENLKFHANMYGVDRKVREERIAEVLEMVELDDRVNDLVKKFSGGMKRRLEIARGLLHYPKVLFLDEPTLGLDPQTRNRIWEYIYQLKDEKDITIFLTTHYMDEAEYCDRIAIIDYGEIIALDTPEELKSVVGGDVIKTRVANIEAAKEKIESKYQVEVKENKGYLHFEQENGEEFIPRFVQDFKDEIKSISLHRPTLDDVFLHLTGHELREKEADATERMRNNLKKRGRR